MSPDTAEMQHETAPVNASLVDIICLCNYHGVGGAQLDAGLLVSEFARRGYRAELGFLFEREVLSRHGTDDYFVLAPRKPRGLADWWRFLVEARERLVRRRPKAIVGFFPMANILGAVAARLAGSCRMVATQRNPSDQQAAAVGALEKVVGGSRLYHSNIAISQTVASSFDAYPARYREKIEIVYNGTPPLPVSGGDREAARARFGMPAGLVLGCLGRLHPQKNPHFALEVAARLPGVQLYLAGEGPEEQSLRARAAELGIESDVHFLGSLNGVDVSRFYQAIDVLLFPSIFEGFGRVLVEAMSQGTPVVASDIAIAREVGGEAVTFRAFEPDGWVEAIRQVAPGGSRHQEAIEAGRARAAVFSMEAMIDGYLKAAGLPLRADGVGS